MPQHFSRVPVVALAEMISFAVISEALKHLKGARKPIFLRFRLKYLQLPARWAEPASVLPLKQNFLAIYEHVFSATEIKMMRRFQSRSVGCQKKYEAAEVLMRSSRQNFITPYNSKANNKDGGWMLLLLAARDRKWQYGRTPTSNQGQTLSKGP